MKKLGIILVFILLVTAVLFSAGCVTEKKSQEINTVLDIIVTKDGGSTYCVGDTLTVNLPDYAYDGYSWQVTYSDGFDVKKKTLTPEEAGGTDSYGSYSSFTISPKEEGGHSFIVKFMEEGDESSAMYIYDDSMQVDNSGDHTTCSFTFSGDMLPSRGDYISIIYQKSASTKDCSYETYARGLTSGLSVVGVNSLPAGSTYGGEYGAFQWILTAKDTGKYYFGVEEFSPEGENQGLKFYMAVNFEK